jgi:hypothetical protein
MYADAIAQSRPAHNSGTEVVSNRHLLVDPTMATNGFRFDDGREAMLDEKSRTDPTRTEDQGGIGPV